MIQNKLASSILYLSNNNRSVSNEQLDRSVDAYCTKPQASQSSDCDGYDKEKKEEEKEILSLVAKAKEGDNKSFEKLLKKYEKIINTIKKRFYIGENHFNNGQMEHKDFYSVGYYGLHKAVLKYDIDKDVKFSTYAYSCIQNEMNDLCFELERKTSAPRQTIQLFSKVKRECNNYNEYDTVELAEKFNESQENIKKALVYNNTKASTKDVEELHSMPSNEEYFCTSASVEEETDYQLLIDHIIRAMQGLSQRDREIMSYRYGLNGYDEKDVNEIAELFNLTPTRVRQIIKSAIIHLRSHVA